MVPSQQETEKQACRQLSSHDDNLRVVLASTAGLMSGMILAFPCSMQIWLKHYKGDYVAQATMQSNLMAMSSALAMFINPIVSNLMDVLGRKPVMIGSLAVATFSRAMVAMKPASNALILESVLMPLAMGQIMTAETVIGDCFKSDGTTYGSARARLMIIMPLCGVVCPVLGGVLAQRVSIRAPYAVGAVLSMCAIVISVKSFKETLLPEDKRPLAFKTANPLSFLHLFQHSMKLSILTAMRALSNITDRRALGSTEALYRQQVFGLGMQARSAFMSAASLSALPGYIVAGKLLRRIGARSCIWLGIGLDSTKSLLAGEVATLSHHYWLLLLGSLRGAASSGESAMLQDEANRCGLKQGEMQGHLANLDTLTRVIAPLFWAKLYSHGIRKARPAFFMQIAAFFGFAQLLLEILLQRRDKDPCNQ